MERTETPQTNRRRNIIVGLTVLGLSAAGITAAMADSSGTTSAEWSANCDTVTITSTKDISNIVYSVDGEDTKIEFSDGTHTYELDGSASDVWVKAGNNKSGDGPGYGEHYARPASCDDISSVSTTLPIGVS